MGEEEVGCKASAGESVVDWVLPTCAVSALGQTVCLAFLVDVYRFFLKVGQ